MVIRDHYVNGVVTPGGTDHDDVFGLLPAAIARLDTTYKFPTPPAAPQFAMQGRPGDSADPNSAGFPTYDGLPEEVKFAVNTVFVHFGKAIAAYERLVVSRNSDFDKFEDVLGINGLVPLGLTAEERSDLVAFLLALDGEDLPTAVTSVPVLPP